jgi:acetyl esterase/lipase
MKLKVKKYLLPGLLIMLIFSCLLMTAPRILSALYPGKPPVGYHFIAADYLAVGIGLEKIVNRTPVIPEDIEEIRGIEYKNIDGKSLQLDICKPKNLSSNAPLLVFIHGGGWRSGQRSDYLIYLIAFAEKGYITASVSYRLLKDAPYPACVEDVSDAVEWFYRNGENYGYDPDRIALIGGSAGAHLALLVAYGWKNPDANIGISRVPETTHHIKAVVDIYGPVDLTTTYGRNQPLVTSFIARSFQEAPQLYMEASPVTYLNKNNPPTMILHGTSDHLVPVSQSDTLKAKLDRLGVPCVYYRLPLWPHTMDIVKRVNEFAQLKMNDFFGKYLK